MAEGLLERLLETRGCAGFTVRSAGTWARPGIRATSDAVSVAGEMGVDLTGHRSRELTDADIRRADLVVAMTSVHVQEVLELAPKESAKVVMLKELAEIDAGAPGERSPEQALRSLLEGPRPEPRRRLDVDDPMGLPRSAYVRAAREIERGVTALADALCPEREKEA